MEKRGITLEADGDGVMTGSDALIYRLIFNLTENAVKYNRPGGSVRVCVIQETEKLLIRVSDTGCGIPDEYQQSIFQPFFRVDKSRSREYGGAGLGLSLVWEIAPFGWRRVRRKAPPLRWSCRYSDIALEISGEQFAEYRICISLQINRLCSGSDFRVAPDFYCVSGSQTRKGKMRWFAK